jgi:hypothetical protein
MTADGRKLVGTLVSPSHPMSDGCWRPGPWEKNEGTAVQRIRLFWNSVVVVDCCCDDDEIAEETIEGLVVVRDSVGPFAVRGVCLGRQVRGSSLNVFPW